MEKCERKERQEFRIAQNPSLLRKRKEKTSVSRKSLTDWKGNANAEIYPAARTSVP
jgi:hypothetical protein